MAQIKISNEVLELQGNEKTFFDTDEAAGQTSLSANGTNFVAADYIVLGKLGTEKSEIVKIASVSASLINLVSPGTIFSHNRGDLISYIPYNQIVLERSTDGGANYSALTAVDIQADNKETIIQRPTDTSTDYYRVRFYNSTTSAYSEYSDVITGDGYADNTVFSIKERALDDLGETKNDLITDSFLNQALWKARRELDEDPRVLRWEFRQKFNQTLGSIVPGTWRITVPTDLRDPNTNKNILNLRVGRYGHSLKYIDNNEFFSLYQNVAHSTISSPITSGSTSIVLSSSGDFDESGTIKIAASTVAQTIDSVEYTANNEITDTLSGVTGIADSKAADIDVWQQVTFGLPNRYTVFAGYIYFDVPFADEYAGEDIKIDYYGELVAYNSDADILDEPEYDLFVSYLKYRIKYKKANGMLENAKADIDYVEWQQGKDRLITKEVSGQTGYFVPN